MPIDLRFDPDEAPLMIDLYELTMAASYFALGYNRTGVLLPERAADAAEAGISGRGGNRARAGGARRNSISRPAAIEYLDSLKLFSARVSRLSREPAIHRRRPRGAGGHDLLRAGADPGSARAADRGADSRDTAAQPDRDGVDGREQGGTLRDRGARPAADRLRAAAEPGRGCRTDRRAIELSGGLRRNLERAGRPSLRDSAERHDGAQLHHGARQRARGVR